MNYRYPIPETLKKRVDYRLLSNFIDQDCMNINFTFSTWSFVFAASINTCIGNLLLKRSRLEAPDPGLVSLVLSPWFISGLVFYSINVVLFGKALDKLPVSTAYPVFAGLGFGLIAITGSWFFQERLGVNQYLGLGIILIGIIVMSRS